MLICWHGKISAAVPLSMLHTAGKQHKQQRSRLGFLASQPALSLFSFHSKAEEKCAGVPRTGISNSQGGRIERCSDHAAVLCQHLDSSFYYHDQPLGARAVFLKK